MAGIFSLETFGLPILEGIAASQALLSEVGNGVPADSVGIVGADRVGAALEYVKERLLSVDPRTISKNSLEDILADLSTLQTELTQVTTGSTFEQLLSLPAVDKLLLHATQLPPSPWRLGQEEVGELIIRLKNETSVLGGTLRSEVDQMTDNLIHSSEDFESAKMSTLSAVTEKVSETEAHLDALKQNSDSQAAGFEAKLVEFDSRVRTQVDRLDASLNTLNQQFVQSQADRLQQFAAETKERELAFQTLITEEQGKFDEVASQQRKDGQGLIEYLQKTATSAEHILSVTAASVTAGAYLNDAQNQRGQADLLRVVSFVLGGVAAVFGYFSLLQLQLGPDAEVVTRIYQYAARTGILVLLVSFAVYAGRESSKHRSRENESKRLANQLSTFRPFLAELDSASRDDLVKGASERYFPGYDGSYAGENLIEAAKKVKSDGASKEIVELLTNLLKVFQK